MAEQREDAPTRESALAVLRKIRAEAGSDPNLASLNEAKTRLLVIDELLMALGWPKHEFNPEERAGGTGFTDYLLSIEDRPRLVVEAKRTGRTFKSNKRHTKSEYTLSYVRSAFGQMVSDVLEQARGYAKEHGVPFAAITNGGEWLLVQLIPHPGQEADDLKCFYFGDLLREDGNFDLFWELLSRNAIASGQLGESFAELNATEFEYSAVPRRELGGLMWRRGDDSDTHLDEFYRMFMDEIVDPARRHMLQHCFVSNARLDQYEGNLKRVLRDAVPAYIDAQRDLTPGDHETLLAGDSGDQRGRVVLITGSVGCGKSTFVTRILVDTRKEQRSQSLLIDLIDQVDEPTTDVTGLLWRKVLDDWRKHEPESMQYTLLKTIFHGELEGLRRGPKAKVFEVDDAAFRQAEADLLDGFTRSPEVFLPRCWRHYRKQLSKGVVVFLDNVDRASEDFQRRTYAFAHSLAASTGATVIVPMREMTFFRGKSAGFLDIRSSDIVCHLQAPDPVQVLSKRIRYVEGQLEHDHRYGRWKREEDAEALIEACRKHARTLKQQLLEAPSGKYVIELASAVAWHDIRSFLTYIHQIHSALKDTAWTPAVSVAALIVPRDLGSRASIPNLYSPPYPAYPSMFVKARVLALLLYSAIPDRVKQGLPLSAILRVLRVYGYRDRWSRRAVEDLVRDRLLECLEAPAAAEYTKSYELDSSHSFRPSPLAVALVERIQYEPAYLSIIGADITFHSRRNYSDYVSCVKGVLEAVGDGQLDTDGLALLLESEAPTIVGAYLRHMFEKERPLPDLPRYFPEVSAIESLLKASVSKLPGSGRTASRDTVPPTSSNRPLAHQTSFDLPDQASRTSDADSQPMVPLPEMLPEARIKQSTLGPAIFWALAELQARGRTPATGAEITVMINAYVFSDQERKEQTNVSRALRQPNLREQGWLAVHGEKGSWKYGLSSSWRRDWSRLFKEPAPQKDIRA